MKRLRTTAASTLFAVAAMTFVTACSGNYRAKEDTAPAGGAQRDQPITDSVFGDGGLSLSSISDGTLFSSSTEDGSGALPVNKFLWQASLDTLSFLPLSSTDPFTGVIATDWGSTADAPGERFKVTAYILNPNLAASSLKVAVFREERNEDGLWIPAAVNPETALKIEDSILTRARQIRIASIEDETTG
ncbi:MAG: DUF3576 domain-containing protein [Pseudomonadota bacterium]